MAEIDQHAQTYLNQTRSGQADQNVPAIREEEGNRLVRLMLIAASDTSEAPSTHMLKETRTSLARLFERNKGATVKNVISVVRVHLEGWLPFAPESSESEEGQTDVPETIILDHEPSREELEEADALLNALKIQGKYRKGVTFSGGVMTHRLTLTTVPYKTPVSNWNLPRKQTRVSKKDRNRNGINGDVGSTNH
ncbi:MAG: hypothetical protein WCG83_01375 [Candidatus Peregrinibacteria bacterium]